MKNPFITIKVKIKKGKREVTLWDYLRLGYWLHFFWLINAWQVLFGQGHYQTLLTKANRKQHIHGMNIYDAGPTMQDYVKQHRRIHEIFKYMFFMPGISLCKWVLGRYLVKEIPKDKLQFKNLRIFEEAYDKSVYDWCDKILSMDRNDTEPENIKLIRDQHLNGRAARNMRDMKQIMLTVVKNDTAYLEFFNILMFNLTIAMNREHPEQAQHLAYHGSAINDVKYFVALHQLNYGLKLHELQGGGDDDNKEADANHEP